MKDGMTTQEEMESAIRKRIENCKRMIDLLPLLPNVQDMKTDEIDVHPILPMSHQEFRIVAPINVSILEELDRRIVAKGWKHIRTNDAADNFSGIRWITYRLDLEKDEKDELLRRLELVIMGYSRNVGSQCKVVQIGEESTPVYEIDCEGALSE